MRPGVIGGGNFIVDYVKTVDVYPSEQALANIHREYTGSGGAPYNVLRNLALLGVDFPLRAIGRIGGDDAGGHIRDDCQSLGIDTRQLKLTKGCPTSYTLVMVVENTGRRTFFHQRGANALLAPDDFDFADTSGSHFHYGYLLLLDRMDQADEEYGTAAARVLARAKAAGLTTSIDVVSEDSDRFQKIVAPALKHADLVFMNEFEASRSSGVQLFGNGSFLTGRILEAHGALQPAGTLVIHWPEGAAACTPDGSITWQGSVQLPQEKVASVVGSGDAFAAGYLLDFVRGEDTRQCLRLAACSAAACITGYTCTDGMVSESECRALGDRYGYGACP